MCYFLAVGVKADGAVLLDTEQAQRHRGSHLTISRARNPSLASIFPSADRLYWITSGMCSCDLHRGELADTSELAANARARFAKKGWSEAKIDRAIAAKQAPRSTVPCEQRPDTPRDLLGDLLSRLSATEGGVRMLLHFYRGSPDSEQASGSVGNDLDVRKVVEGAEFPVDTLIQITHAS